MDHLCTKVEAYKAINTGKTPSGNVSDHTQCRLGNWYYKGEGKHRYDKESAYKQLEEPHKTFHTAFNNAIEASNNNDTQNTEEQLAKMEQASQQVMDCLDRLATKMGSHK
jgi:hypothetical protein